MNSIKSLSIITVNLDDKSGLSRTVESVKSQNFHDFEFIIIDGGSKDGSLEVIKENETLIDYWVSEKDSGIYNAMNKGIKISKGEIIVFINSGDLFKKNALKLIRNLFEKNKSLDFVFGTVKRHYTKSTILKYGFNKNRLKYNFDFATAHSTGFFLKKKIFKKYGLFNTKYKCSADYDLYYRLILKNKIIGSFTKKNQLIWIVKSGGYSSKISFFEHIIEETKIRYNNGQNIFFIFLIFFNAILKFILK